MFEAIADSGKAFGRGLERGIASNQADATKAAAAQKAETERLKQVQAGIEKAMTDTEASMASLLETATKARRMGGNVDSIRSAYELQAKDRAATKAAFMASIVKGAPQLADMLPPYDPMAEVQQELSRFDSIVGTTETREQERDFEVQTAGMEARAKAEAELPSQLRLAQGREAAAARFRAPPNPNVINLVSPDGTQRRAVDANNQRGELTRMMSLGWTKVDQSVTGASQDDLVPRAADISAWRESSIATQTMLNTVGRLREQLSDTDLVTGLTGQATQLVDNIASQALQITKSLTGVDESSLLEDTGAYDFGALSNRANQSAAFRSNLMSLAYAMARAAEPENRGLTEGDIQRQLSRLGGAQAKGQFASVLDEVERETKNAYVIRHNVMRSSLRGAEGKGPDIGEIEPWARASTSTAARPAAPAVVSVPANKAQAEETLQALAPGKHLIRIEGKEPVEVWKVTSSEEYQKVPPGALFLPPGSGKPMRKPSTGRGKADGSGK